VSLLLSEALPLRTTRMLGDFAASEVLPLRFGDLRGTRFPLVKLTDVRWLVADHDMEVTAVFIDDEETKSYAVVSESDAAGHTWTVVRLAAPAPPDARVSGSGLGLKNPDTGALIENPADIAEYLLRLAGRTEIFPHLSYTLALGAFRLGMGAAVSLVLFPLLVLLIIFLTRRMLRPSDE